jgi:hypothetical protein
MTIGKKTIMRALVAVAGIDRFGRMYLIKTDNPAERRNTFKTNPS